MKSRLSFVLPLLVLACLNVADAEEASEITHSFLACGQKTYIMGEDNHASWTYPDSTRDGYVLDNGKAGMHFIPVDELKTICTVMDHTELEPKK